MIRNSRTPTLLLIGMVVVIIIITYNYWSLLERNKTLSDRLINSEEKLSDLNEKKAMLEKQGTNALDKVKSFEEKVEKNEQALQKKDSEIDELNTKLKSHEQDNEKLSLEIAEIKEKLNSCKLTEKDKLDSLQNKYDILQNLNNELKLNISQVEDKLKISPSVDASSCVQPIDAALIGFKSRLTGLVNSNFDSVNAKKIKALLDGPNPVQSNQTETTTKIAFKTEAVVNRIIENIITKENKTQNEVPVPRVLRDTELASDICLLPKEAGKCDKNIERYYFDNESDQCLIFVYNGCDGNSNNFENIDQCKEQCSNKKSQLNDDLTTEQQIVNEDETTQV